MPHPDRWELELARLRFIRRAQAKLVEERIAALKRMRTGLAKLIEACPGPGHGRAAGCPILQALGGEDGQ